MRTQIVALSILVALCVPLAASAQTRGDRSWNLLAAILKSPAQQDTFTKDIAKQLAMSQVPTWRDAARIAANFVVTHSGLPSDEIWEVTGLYVIGVDVPDYAARNDLVWEVGFFNVPGVRRVLWVSTTTKAVKTVFP